MEVKYEPLELENQRLEVEKRGLDPARQRWKVGGSPLDHGEGAGLGLNTGPGRADRRQAGGPCSLTIANGRRPPSPRPPLSATFLPLGSEALGGSSVHVHRERVLEKGGD